MHTQTQTRIRRLHTRVSHAILGRLSLHCTVLLRQVVNVKLMLIQSLAKTWHFTEDHFSTAVIGNLAQLRGVVLLFKASSRANNSLKTIVKTMRNFVFYWKWSKYIGIDSAAKSCRGLSSFCTSVGVKSSIVLHSSMKLNSIDQEGAVKSRRQHSLI